MRYAAAKERGDSLVIVFSPFTSAGRIEEGLRRAGCSREPFRLTARCAVLPQAARRDLGTSPCTVRPPASGGPVSDAAARSVRSGGNPHGRTSSTCGGAAHTASRFIGFVYSPGSARSGVPPAVVICAGPIGRPATAGRATRSPPPGGGPANRLPRGGRRGPLRRHLPVVERVRVVRHARPHPRADRRNTRPPLERPLLIDQNSSTFVPFPVENGGPRPLSGACSHTSGCADAKDPLWWTSAVASSTTAPESTSPTTSRWSPMV